MPAMCILLQQSVHQWCVCTLCFLLFFNGCILTCFLKVRFMACNSQDFEFLYDRDKPCAGGGLLLEVLNSSPSPVTKWTLKNKPFLSEPQFPFWKMRGRNTFRVTNWILQCYWGRWTTARSEAGQLQDHFSEEIWPSWPISQWKKIWVLGTSAFLEEKQ